MTQAIEAVRAGFQLSLQYNTVFAGAVAAIAAALMSRPARRGLATFGVFTLIAGWLVGDGMRIIASARDLYDSAGALLPDAGTTANVVALVVWGLGTLFVGYVLPAWAGAFVGRRVTWGTGFIAAIAVSVTCSGAIAVIAAALAS